ncbi:MAG TPA: aminoglycoside phosphotransferase [Acetobacteraceae bacterium]|jgi:fructosamine-3-kinase|nr:aminoglycoside phosphotransferase [Acetobacteraceae bacterium]
METPPKDILDALARMRLLGGEPSTGEPPTGEPPTGEPLTGGVSSDIWRIDLAGGPICVKRALPKLRVAADWQAPVERNRFEARWMRVASSAVPHSTPTLVGQDEASGTLAMEYLPADRYPLWKAQLRDGIVDPAFAASVAVTLGRIHAATAAAPGLAADFPTDAIFYDIRLEPYLAHTGLRHPDLAAHMRRLIETTQRNKLAMVHGDVSPKNILAGPDGPVFLDAECAWWGDPAFDLAFCLNHLMLKCLWVPTRRDALLKSFRAMTEAYLPLVAWEPPDRLEQRVAHLLPALFLARVDGKSPVEYITQDEQRDAVRRVAVRLLTDPPDRLADVAKAWAKELAA